MHPGPPQPAAQRPTPPRLPPTPAHQVDRDVALHDRRHQPLQLAGVPQVDQLKLCVGGGGRGRGRIRCAGRCWRRGGGGCVGAPAAPGSRGCCAARLRRPRPVWREQRPPSRPSRRPRPRPHPERRRDGQQQSGAGPLARERVAALDVLQRDRARVVCSEGGATAAARAAGVRAGAGARARSATRSRASCAPRGLPPAPARHASPIRGELRQSGGRRTGEGLGLRARRCSGRGLHGGGARAHGAGAAQQGEGCTGRGLLAGARGVREVRGGRG
jgi:hypothetical protein